MAESEHGILKSVELRLLRCTISGDLPLPSCSPYPNQENTLDPLTHDVLGAIERGDYAAALSSDAARLVFSFANSWEFDNSTNSAALFYSQVERSIDAFLCDGAYEEPWLRVLDARVDANTEYRVAVVLCLGVAALLAFLQQNVTGPVGKFSHFPLPFGCFGEFGDVGNGAEWDSWARSQLTSVGCDLLGKFSFLQYLEHAKVILLKIKDFCTNSAKTTSWWLCRVFLLQQRILDDLSSSLYNLLQVFKNEALLQFGEAKDVVKYWGAVLHEKEALAIASILQVEAGIIEYHYGRIDSSRLHLARAAETFGTNLSVTGVLGYRTIHQVDAKPQLVLIANTGQKVKGNGSLESFSQEQNVCQGILDRKEKSDALDINIIHGGKGVGRTTGLSRVQSDNHSCKNKLDFKSNGHYECDILMAPRLIQDATTVGANGEFAIIGKDVMLTSIQQVIILSQCLHLQRTKRDDELSRWEMAPYIEAIDSQSQSCFIIKYSCDMLRIRWESTRNRTKQRALLMMEKLVEAVYESVPVVARRIQLAFCVYTPTISALRKEYGELSVGCGMVGEALKIFEDLELWDNLIYCYRLLDKKAAAVDLINARLRETPTDPKLWCSLGDVTTNDDCYEKALEVSNNKSARAMRSLARSAYNKGNYEIAKSLWESAMAVNSLYPDGWFALGAAALKARDIDRALDGFTRAVQLDPENGEAWNNVACLHMINKKSKAAFIAFKEALKFRRSSWQLWENYSHVAVDIGNFHQALEAIKMVLDLSSNKRVDIDLLDKILAKIEEYTSRSSPSFHATKDQDICASQEDSDLYYCGDSENLVPALEGREKDLLVSIIGNVLQQIIKNGGGGEEIWGLYARWHKLEGNLAMCSEALLKQVRAYQGSDLWHDLARFKKFAQASLRLCDVYMEIASSNGGRRELFAAEMHLRNSVKQAVSFSDTKEFADLQAYLVEIRKRLDTPNNVS
ncbi:hypothetical protein KFK09_013352 [Dendrobium nobile]|uniref:Tetratricopeptide repeat protein 27 homolog n=1 Tax=Dendrobium nobile TaxID=94219 RepID=A0A8T3B6Y4_DENNO|nr:hypothetical protein KFK09_013352 [Dendrobium nobile]